MKRELIVQRSPKSPVAEVFRTLRTNIQFMNSQKDLKTLLVTSSFNLLVLLGFTKTILHPLPLSLQVTISFKLVTGSGVKVTLLVSILGAVLALTVDVILAYPLPECPVTVLPLLSVWNISTGKSTLPCRVS